MHYTYVLYSEKDCEWYTGATSDLCRSNLLTLRQLIAGSQLTTSAATFKLERHLRARVREHAEGRVRSTEQRRPLLLAYYESRDRQAEFAAACEASLVACRDGLGGNRIRRARDEACLNREDAFRRERYLKTGRGKRYLRQRLAAWRGLLSREKLERRYLIALAAWSIAFV